MRSLLRETCRERLLAVPGTADAYQRGAQPYVQAVLGWMERTERALEPLRSPLVAELAAARAGVQAASDGYRFDAMSADASRRRAPKVAATSGLRLATGALGRVLAHEDEFFDEVTEKMAQLIAVASLESPLPPPTEPRGRWLQEVWAHLGNGNGTAGMRSYLAVRLDAIDRNYVLDGLLRNLEANLQPG